MPPKKAKAPSSRKLELQKCSVASSSFVFIMKKILLPNISIMSSKLATPALIASAAASVVPATTGVPSARPVSLAAVGVILPTTS
jgi:hypothetical protein